MQVLAHAFVEPLECRHERLGHVTPAERPEAAATIRQFTGDRCCQQPLVLVGGQKVTHSFCSTARTALMN